MYPCKEKGDLERCVKALNSLSEFLLEYLPMINVCMVDFITQDVFSNYLSESLQEELFGLTDDEIVELPQLLLSRLDGRDLPTKKGLNSLIQRVSDHSLKSLNASETFDEFERTLSSADVDEEAEEETPTSVLQHFDRIMGEKKTHEVVVLSEVIYRLCSSLGRQDRSVGAIERLVDLGSGKGYLSQALSNVHDFKILAIDASDGNTQGAQKRTTNLERKWNGLMRRAKIRSSGETPPRRGKHWKANKDVSSAENRDIEDPTIVENPSSLAEKHPIEEPTVDKPACNLHTITEFVDTHTDLPLLLGDHFPQQDDDAASNPEFAVIGLHTCGNLATNSVRIFLANPSARLLVNVGCCYHHLDEEFYRNQYLSQEENDAVNACPSFPMSSLLREKRFELGRNARMMASQPTSRMAQEMQLPSQSLLWRAVLQLILDRLHPSMARQEQHVGKTAAKSKDFLDYCRRSFKKLKLELTITDAEVSSTFEASSAQFRHKLNAFYQLRSLFASSIEGLILLDRLVHLLEQVDVREASLVKLFDPVVSPRCYALIAIKECAK